MFSWVQSLVLLLGFSKVQPLNVLPVQPKQLQPVKNVDILKIPLGDILSAVPGIRQNRELTQYNSISSINSINNDATKFLMNVNRFLSAPNQTVPNYGISYEHSDPRSNYELKEKNNNRNKILIEFRQKPKPQIPTKIEIIKNNNSPFLSMNKDNVDEYSKIYSQFKPNNYFIPNAAKPTSDYLNIVDNSNYNGNNHKAVQVIKTMGTEVQQPTILDVKPQFETIPEYLYKSGNNNDKHIRVEQPTQSFVKDNGNFNNDFLSNIQNADSNLIQPVQEGIKYEKKIPEGNVQNYELIPQELKNTKESLTFTNGYKSQNELLIQNFLDSSRTNANGASDLSNNLNMYYNYPKTQSSSSLMQAQPINGYTDQNIQNVAPVSGNSLTLNNGQTISLLPGKKLKERKALKAPKKLRALEEVSGTSSTATESDTKSKVTTSTSKDKTEEEEAEGDEKKGEEDNNKEDTNETDSENKSDPSESSSDPSNSNNDTDDPRFQKLQGGDEKADDDDSVYYLLPYYYYHPFANGPMG